MTAYYCKIYIDLLDDMKTGPLPEYIKWRWVALLLVAKEYDQDGLLPPVSALAWRLRLDEDKIAETLSALSSVGVVATQPDGHWYIVNFAKRQASPDPTAADRMQKWRSKQDVTRNVTRNAENPLREMLRVEEESESEEEIKDSEEEEAGGRAGGFLSEMQAAEILTAVSGLITFPSSSRENDIDRLRAIYRSYPGDVCAYLRPFWEEWSGKRGYSKANTGWLDWAIAGEIPKRRNGRETAKDGAKGGETGAIARARERLKNGKR